MATDGRKAKRQSVQHDGVVHAASGEAIARCRLRNISKTGAQIELSRDVDLPQRFVLSLSSQGQVHRRCHLVWQFSTVVGARFDK